MKYKINKITAIIITLIFCGSCFFWAEKAEASMPPFWYGLIGYTCLYVEILDIGDKIKTEDDITWVQIEVNIIESYLKDFSGDLYIPDDCVDFVLSYNHALIFLTECDGDLMCSFEYDADSSMVIPFFPIENNKIIIPENYYKPFTYGYGQTEIEACCDELAYIEYFNQDLLEDEQYLAFSDGTDVELLDDYFNLVNEKYADYMLFMLTQRRKNILLLIFYISIYISLIGIPICIITVIIGTVKKRKKTNTLGQTK